MMEVPVLMVRPAAEVWIVASGNLNPLVVLRTMAALTVSVAVAVPPITNLAFWATALMLTQIKNKLTAKRDKDFLNMRIWFDKMYLSI